MPSGFTCLICGADTTPASPGVLPPLYCTACAIKAQATAQMGQQAAAQLQQSINAQHRANLAAQLAAAAAGSGLGAGILQGQAQQQYPSHGALLPRCARCGCGMPPDTPHWQTMCRACYGRERRAEEEKRINEALQRALSAEAQLKGTLKAVADMQARIRQLEGEARRAGGQVGLRRQPIAAGVGFTVEELRALRRLAHPDKHGNSDVANALCARINQLLREQT